MIDLKKVIEKRIDEIDAMRDPEQAAVAAQHLWDILQGARESTTPLRVKTLRALRDFRREKAGIDSASSNQAKADSASSNQALADFLKIKVTGVNVLLRGGSKVLPKYTSKKKSAK